jgi:hypothetical protein
MHCKLLLTNFAKKIEPILFLTPPNEKAGGWGLLSIPIRNYGHVSAKNAVLNATFERWDFSEIKRLRDRRQFFLKATTEIFPGDSPAYTWLIFIPQEITAEDKIAIAKSTETMRVIGKLTYDSGFGTIETVGICYGLQNIRNQWERCSGDTTVWLADTPNTKNKEPKG